MPQAQERKPPGERRADRLALPYASSKDLVLSHHFNVKGALQHLQARLAKVEKTVKQREQHLHNRVETELLWEARRRSPKCHGTALNMHRKRVITCQSTDVSDGCIRTCSPRPLSEGPQPLAAHSVAAGSDTLGATTALDPTRSASTSSARALSPLIRLPSVTNSQEDSDDDAKTTPALHQRQGKAADTRGKLGAGPPRASSRGAHHADGRQFSGGHLATREANVHLRPITRDDLLPRNTWHFFEAEREAKLVVTERLERRRLALGIRPPAC